MQIEKQPDNIIDRLIHQRKASAMRGAVAPSKIALSEIDFIDFGKLNKGGYGGAHDKFIEELAKLKVRRDREISIENFVRSLLGLKTLDFAWVKAGQEWWAVMYFRPNDSKNLQCTEPFATKERAVNEADRLVASGTADPATIRYDYSANHIIDP